MRQTIRIFGLMLFSAIVMPGAALAGENKGGQDDSDANKIVRAKGALGYREVVELRNQTGHSMTIVHLVPEGTKVKKGDLVARFDDSTLKEQLADQTIIMINSKAELIDAESSIVALKIEHDAENELAKLQLKLAEKFRQRYLGGDGELEVELKKAQSELIVAQGRLQIAELRLQSAQKVDATTEKKQELKLQIAAAKAALEATKAMVTMLDGPEREYRAAMVQLELRKSELALKRIESNFELQETRARANLQAKKERLNLEEDKRENLNRRLAMCRLHAPQDGRVTYAHIRDRRGNGLEIKPGVIIRDRQAVARLPDMNQLEIRALVEESSIRKIRVGQPVNIRVDALPEHVFNGKVVNITPYAAPGSFLNGSNGRRYSVAVSIEKPLKNLKPRMVAEVQIDTSK